MCSKGLAADGGPTAGRRTRGLRADARGRRAARRVAGLVIDTVVLPGVDVRRCIASAILEDTSAIPERLGSIVLRARQRVAAERLVSLIEADRGALLADPVGLG